MPLQHSARPAIRLQALRPRPATRLPPGSPPSTWPVDHESARHAAQSLLSVLLITHRIQGCRGIRRPLGRTGGSISHGLHRRPRWPGQHRPAGQGGRGEQPHHPLLRGAWHPAGAPPHQRRHAEVPAGVLRVHRDRAGPQGPRLPAGRGEAAGPPGAGRAVGPGSGPAPRSWSRTGSRRWTSRPPCCASCATACATRTRPRRSPLGLGSRSLAGLGGRTGGGRSSSAVRRPRAPAACDPRRPVTTGLILLVFIAVLVTFFVVRPVRRRMGWARPPHLGHQHHRGGPGHPAVLGVPDAELTAGRGQPSGSLRSGISNQTALPSGVGREPHRVASWSTR